MKTETCDAVAAEQKSENNRVDLKPGSNSSYEHQEALQIIMLLS